MPCGESSRWTRTSYQRWEMPTACSSSASSTSRSASALSKNRRQARSRSGDGLDNASSFEDSPLCNCLFIDCCESYQQPGRSTRMAAIAAERAQLGYALHDNEGEAFWLLGMLQTIKISREDTGGAYGLVEIVVPEGLGSPW